MEENTNKKVIVRFAPSPTGRFHIGGVRSALFNYLFAKHNSGTFILRSDDTDKERSKGEYEDEILEVFKWLGLDYDKFFRQSERGEIYKKYLQKMIDDGFAYVSKEEKKEVGDRDEVIRYKNPNKKITFNDLILGEISVNTDDLGDFVLAKDLDTPIYHTTSIIDDFEMEITHVIRGQEHTVNTIRQILIQEAIGAQRPIYAHIPLILNSERAKLSKRDPLVLPAIQYKELGYLPEGILNFLALIGWNPGGEQEIFSLPELIDKFDLSKVQKGAGIFNSEKLEWINKEHIKLMPEKNRNEKILEWLTKNEILTEKEKLQDENFMSKLFPIIFDRISKWGDVDTLVSAGELQYFFAEPQYKKEMLVWKDSSLENAKKHLRHVAEILEKAPADSFDGVEKIKSLIFDYATEEGRGNVLWPLRVSLSGKEKSPDPFTLIYILGREESVKRINEAIIKI